MNYQKIISAVSALTLAGCMLTGCGSSPAGTGDAQQTLQSQADSVQDSNSESSESGGNNGAAAHADIQDARKVLEAFFEGCKTGSADLIINNSDVGEATKLASRFDGQELSDEQLRQNVVEMFGGITDYTIDEGAMDLEQLNSYNEMVTEILQDIDESGSRSDETEYFRKMVRPVDAIAEFPVTYTQNGQSYSESFMVSYEYGGWSVNMSMYAVMKGYIQKSKTASANTAAKSVYNACNTALVDLDTQDIRLDALNGEFFLTGSDFENLTKPENAESDEEIRQLFMYTVTVYFSDITKVKGIAFCIEENACTGAAAEYETNEITYFGTYPTVRTTADELSDLHEALTFAVQD